MPSKYHKYTDEALKSALNAVKLGMAHATASKKYGVPRSTIIAKIKGIYPEECKSGKSTTLSIGEEEILVNWIISLGKTGFPVTKEQLLDSVALLIKKLKRKSDFKDGRPGRHWYEGFLKRHPDISLRMTQNLTSSRAAVSEVKIRSWFNEIKSYFKDNKIQIDDPKRVFNADEVGFCLAPKGKQALVKKGSKAVYNFANANERESITTLVTGNAAGEFAPPMVVFSYDRIPKHIVIQFPDKWGLGKSENGWMTSETFFEYISNIFYPWLLENKVELPVILYVDGHKSHVTMELSEFCSDKGIILISLVPNATHILQPMDVGVFHPLKMKWRNAISKWRLENKKQLLRKDHFAPLLKECLECLDGQVILKNSFRVCGLFPFQENNVDYSKCLASGDQIIHATAEYSLNKEDLFNHLNFLEKRIGSVKIDEFKEAHKASAWLGNIEDKSLFDLWQSLVKETESRSCVDPNNLHNEPEKGKVPVDNVQDFIVLEGEWINDLVNENCPAKPNDERQETDGDSIIIDFSEDIGEDRSEILRTPETNEYLKDVSNHQEKPEINESDILVLKDNHNEGNVLENNMENISPSHQTPIKTVTLVTENSKSDASCIIPSPFKNVLFWPSTTSSDKKKKIVREKVPSVCSSEKWKEYYRKKEEEKKRKENEIQERKRKREETRISKNKDKKAKKKVKETPRETHQATSEEDNDINANSEKPDGEKPNKLQLSVGEYVIVQYNDEKFPGKITKMENECALVSVMVNSGLNKWKWPSIPDELEYDFTEIVEKILEPKAVNNRNTFIVPEFEKYQNYLT